MPYKNIEYRREFMRRYRAANREKILADKREYMKSYKEKNPEKVAEQQRAYRTANREKIAAKRKPYYQANKERIIAGNAKYQRKRYAEDIDFRILMNIRTRFYALLTNKEGRSTLDFLDYTMGELRYHIATRFERGMSWDNYGEWHIDHIIPCASFDHQDPTQVRECWALSNLQPLWASDNRRKGAKILF
jgi:hypothetical protein